MVLNDELIRKELKSFLGKRKPTPEMILEEVRVHNGNAIADIVTVHTKMHCYEIKGETDNLARIVSQGAFYDSTFPRVTLVTTRNHVTAAMSLIPKNWGVLEAKIDSGTVSFSYVRKSMLNTRIEINKALTMLWRSELAEMYSDVSNKLPKTNMNREQLTLELAPRLTVEELNKRLANFLLTRIYNKSLQM